VANTEVGTLPRIRSPGGSPTAHDGGLRVNNDGEQFGPLPRPTPLGSPAESSTANPRRSPTQTSAHTRPGRQDGRAAVSLLPVSQLSAECGSRRGAEWLAGGGISTTTPLLSAKYRSPEDPAVAVEIRCPRSLRRPWPSTEGRWLPAPGKPGPHDSVRIFQGARGERLTSRAHEISEKIGVHAREGSAVVVARGFATSGARARLGSVRRGARVKGVLGHAMFSSGGPKVRLAAQLGAFLFFFYPFLSLFPNPT
jgi:hypothetical protein